MLKIKNMIVSLVGKELFKYKFLFLNLLLTTLYSEERFFFEIFN